MECLLIFIVVVGLMELGLCRARRCLDRKLSTTPIYHVCFYPTSIPASASTAICRMRQSKDKNMNYVYHVTILASLKQHWGPKK